MTKINIEKGNGKSLQPFLTNLPDWVDSFKIDDRSGNFSVKQGKKAHGLYGNCDMIFNLVISDELKSYFSSHENENPEEWILHVQSYQDSKTGWFKEKPFNYEIHFKEHSTAFAVSALNLLGGKPKYPFKISKQLDSKDKVEKWLNKTPEWGLVYWAGSHRGGGVASMFATLGPERYPHERFFDWYFDWLDKRADPEVGFWRIGWIHKLHKNRLTKQELGGSIHYYWIYEFMHRPIPYPEKVIDSTLNLQNNLGLWDGNISYCIDLDAIFSLTRCCKQANGYRKEDIKNAIVWYLNYTIPTLNDRDFLFNRYKSSHKLTGCLETIAEIQKYFPDFVKTPRPWKETLDTTPWI